MSDVPPSTVTTSLAEYPLPPLFIVTAAQLVGVLVSSPTAICATPTALVPSAVPHEIVALPDVGLIHVIVILFSSTYLIIGASYCPLRL